MIISYKKKLSIYSYVMCITTFRLCDSAFTSSDANTSADRTCGQSAPRRVRKAGEVWRGLAASRRHGEPFTKPLSNN